MYLRVSGERLARRLVRPRCEDMAGVVMVREDRGATCTHPAWALRQGRGRTHGPGGQPPGNRGCRGGDTTCQEFRAKCFNMINGCGEKGTMSQALFKSTERKRNNRFVINDIPSYSKARRQRQGVSSV